MSEFDQFQALWQQQAGPAARPAAEVLMDRATQNHRQLRAEHRGTLLILSATVLLVGLYVWWYETTTHPIALGGSGLMLLSLLVRIGVEYGSYRLFARIGLTTDLRTCLARIARFSRVRKAIQWVITPLSLGAYVWGFALLLPFVKAAVTPGFYWYIISSGVVFLVVLSVIIYRQVQREMALLTQLEESYGALITE